MVYGFIFKIIFCRFDFDCLESENFIKADKGYLTRKVMPYE